MFYVPKPTTDGTENNIKTKNVKTGPTSSLRDYETELSTLREEDVEFIRDYALYGNLRSSKIRSIFWRILLNVIPTSPSKWQKQIHELRSNYNTLKSDLTLDPHRSPCSPDDNPLSQDANSVWYRYFCDTELRRVIRQDVIRTSPEKHFFQSSHIQEIMIDVLFVYARKNPDICYRQGMHEILALLLYVIHEDCQRFESCETAVKDSMLSEILDIKYLEHDLFYLFTAIMKRMEKFYESDYSSVPNACGHFPSSLSNDSKNTNNIHFVFEEPEESGISLHVNSVIRNNLAVNDPTLYQYLKKLNIPYTAFGIRWLRLIFGREFPLVDLFVLWDAIFAVDCDFVLINHILVSMLIGIRNELINHDYVQCLSHLMNYPRTVNISYIVSLALHLNDPKVYKKPRVPTISVSELSKISTKVDSTKSKINNVRNTSKSTTPNSKKKLMKLNITKKAFSISGEPKHPNVCDSKNYEKMVAEIKHMRVVMSLCKLKLYQYHDILATSLIDDDVKAQHALTGIQELCTLLEIDHFSLKSSPDEYVDVETAREAGDVTPSYTNGESSPHATEDAVTMCLPPPKTDIDMTTFSCTERSFTDPSNFPSECPHIATTKMKNSDHKN